MCLSTVYKNTLTPETVMMRNVMRIECKDGCVILTDLMERQMVIEGNLEMANLVDGVAVVKEAAVGEKSCPGCFASGVFLRKNRIVDFPFGFMV